MQLVELCIYSSLLYKIILNIEKAVVAHLETDERQTVGIGCLMLVFQRNDSMSFLTRI